MLDIGCGKKPYEKIINEYCSQYIGFDHPETIHGLNAVEIAGDAIDLPFVSNAFDSLVSFQAMEHFCKPSNFLSEAFRVLKCGSFMLLTTPFMWGEHEQPYDYYRYTRYGLGHLAKEAGFEVVCLNADTGSLVSTLLMVNYLLKRLRVGPFRLFLYPVFFVNQLLGLLFYRMDRSHNYAGTATFTALFRKPI